MVWKMEWVADLNIHGHYGGSSSAGSVWVCTPCIRGLAQRVIETGLTKVMAVRVEEMIPLREELDSSEDSEE